MGIVYAEGTAFVASLHPVHPINRSLALLGMTDF